LRCANAAPPVGLGGGFTICDQADQVATVRSAQRDLRIGDARLQPCGAAGAHLLDEESPGRSSATAEL
jgi:hypothetical protein